MSRDKSVPDRVSDEDVEFTIERLHAYKSAVGDPNGEIGNLIRILEILYGVNYDEFDRVDIARMQRVINGIEAEDTQRLDPSFVRDAQHDGFEVIVDINDRVESDGFEHVPLIGREGSE